MKIVLFLQFHKMLKLENVRLLRFNFYFTISNNSTFSESVLKAVKPLYVLMGSNPIKRKLLTHRKLFMVDHGENVCGQTKDGCLMCVLM